jgi:hypothetical protein
LPWAITYCPFRAALTRGLPRSGCPQLSRGCPQLSRIVAVRVHQAGGWPEREYGPANFRSTGWFHQDSPGPNAAPNGWGSSRQVLGEDGPRDAFFINISGPIVLPSAEAGAFGKTVEKSGHSSGLSRDAKGERCSLTAPSRRAA